MVAKFIKSTLPIHYFLLAQHALTKPSPRLLISHFIIVLLSNIKVFYYSIYLAHIPFSTLINYLSSLPAITFKLTLPSFP